MRKRSMSLVAVVSLLVVGPLSAIAATADPAGAATVLPIISTTTTLAPAACPAGSASGCVELVATVSDELTSVLEADVLPGSTVEFDEIGTGDGGTPGGPTVGPGGNGVTTDLGDVSLSSPPTSTSSSSCTLLAGAVRSVLIETCTVDLMISLSQLQATPAVQATYDGDLLASASTSQVVSLG
jgi:hypothetical protein